MKKSTQNVLMDEIAKKWLLQQKRHVKASNYAIYRYTWNRYLSSEFGNMEPNNITEKMVCYYLENKQRLSKTTLHN